MRMKIMTVMMAVGCILLPLRAQATEDLQSSAELLQRDWDNARKDYAARFKAMLGPLNKKIDELNMTLDNGDPKRRKEINEQVARLKDCRDMVRQAIHQITATSVVKLSGLQKHFKNAKDDTKD